MTSLAADETRHIVRARARACVCVLFRETMATAVVGQEPVLFYSVGRFSKDDDNDDDSDGEGDEEGVTEPGAQSAASQRFKSHVYDENSKTLRDTSRTPLPSTPDYPSPQLRRGHEKLNA